jgi:hypothetical protein
MIEDDVFYVVPVTHLKYSGMGTGIKCNTLDM